MSKKILTILIIIVFIISIILIQYIKTPRSFPTDLQIEYSWGACMMGWGRNDLIVNSSGDVSLKSQRGLVSTENSYSFSNGDILSIYQQIVKSNFFGLDEKYHNSDVLDGSCSNLKIIADNKEHVVSITNKSIRAIDKITQKMLDILESKDSDWQDNLDRAEIKICNEARLACKIEDSFQNIPCASWASSCQGVASN